jgi:hypothetical protein
VGGDRYLPTPTGWFSIFAKFSPYTMISPWPRSSYKCIPHRKQERGRQFFCLDWLVMGVVFTLMSLPN